jgi:hypothetical protein
VNPRRPLPPSSRWLLLALVAGCGGAGGLGAWWWSSRRTEGTARSLTPLGPVPSSARAPLACPPGQLPDDEVCLPLPAEPSEAEAESRLELLPGRPAEYARYLTPIAAHPASAPRQGLGVFIPASRGTPVTALTLEAQAGPTRVSVTATTPPRLLTLHRIERGGSLRTYVLAYDGIAFDAPPGTRDVDVGTPLGRVSAGDGATGLSLAVRQLRRDLDPSNVPSERWLLDATSIACDARNVLPLAPAR